MGAHKDICIRFEATKDGETRRFKAVGYLNERESPIDGDEMLRRVPGAIGEEDSIFLDECVGQDWSRDLFPYYLATNRRRPDCPRSVRYFDRDGFGWCRGWRGLGYVSWGDGALVVCRDM